MSDGSKGPTYRSNPHSLRFVQQARKELRERIIVGGMEERALVLEDALAVEGMSTILLGPLLRFKTDENMKKHKKTPLSFDQRIWLLMEIGAIPRKEQTKLNLFRQIRNVMVHNWEINNFTECLNVLKRREELLKMYKQDDRLTVETRLKRCVRKLGTDVRLIIAGVIDRLVDQSWDDAVKEHAVKEINFTAARNAMITCLNSLDVYLRDKLDRDLPFNKQEIAEIPDRLWTMMDKQFHKELKQLLKAPPAQKQEETSSK